jgi:hypothetical protein
MRIQYDRTADTFIITDNRLTLILTGDQFEDMYKQRTTSPSPRTFDAALDTEDYFYEHP